MGVSIDKGWVNDGKGNRVPVWSAEFHYFRNEQKHWRRILQNIKDAGMTVVASFVQPNWHEYAPGQFDFEGKTVPERDLTHLLELAKEIGLYVHLKLGPACCEWRESGGTSFGTKWQDISNAFWDVVGKYSVDNGGSLLLYQIHNEWSHPLGMYYILKPVVDNFDGFRAPKVPFWLELCGPNPHYLNAGYSFSMDYLPKYLASLYPDVSEMNSLWKTDYSSFEAVKEEMTGSGVDTLHKYITYCCDKLRLYKFPGESPRRIVDLLNWTNLYMAAPLSEDVDHTRTRTNLPIMHNWSMYDERKWSKMAHLDLSGYDMYAPLCVDIWTWSKYTYDMQTSPFPFSNEFMCGTIERYEWGGQGFYTDSFSKMEILSYILGGMKGVNLYMFVERDNWLQCPLDERGGKRSTYFTISSMIQGLKRIKWHETKMVHDLGMFKSTDYHRFFDGIDDGMFDEGYRDTSVRDVLYRGHVPKLPYVLAFEALHDKSIDFEVFKDTRGGESIKDYKAILAYSLWFMDRAMANDMLKFVEDGGTLVLYPCVPTHGDDGETLDAFTGKLGLQPFSAEQDIDSHVPVEQIDFDSILNATSGDFETADGKLWAQMRTYGKGRVLALNTPLSHSQDAVEKVIAGWCGCKKYAATSTKETDASMAIHEDGHAVIPAINGAGEGEVNEITIDVSPLCASDVYTVADELSDSLIGYFTPEKGTIHVPVHIGPRDGILLSVTPGQVARAAKPAGEGTATQITNWHTRRENPAVYKKRYLCAEKDESWTSVPITDWTLPAIASGKTCGVQGWFYLKQNVELPEWDGKVYLQVRPNGYHNLGIIYLNGRECGCFMIERPGAESIFDVTDLVNKGGDNTLAIRLYRNSLDCNDRGASGFDVLRFQCGSEVINIDELYLKQERRDFGETDGWASTDASKAGWNNLSLPMNLSMDRSGDALWLRSDVKVTNPKSATLHIEGNNCVVSVFVNGDYVVKSPALPCDFDLSDALKPGANQLALRITPDNFELYTLPQDQRYKGWIQNGLLPLEVKLDKVELIEK